MKRFVLLLTILTALGGGTAHAQKRPLSIDDCRSWQSVDNIDLSADGRWTVYKYRRLYSEGPDSVYLYDAAKRTTRILEHAREQQFLAKGKVLKYNKVNANGENEVYTILLATGKATQWPRGEYMIPMGQSDYVYTGKMGSPTGVTVVNLITGVKVPLPDAINAIIDIPWFVSNGYIVFQPDIHAVVGKPGESCYNAVVSGVKSLIADGIADSARIGVNGHSWGGFETAYLVTRTDLFKCASPCSAVTDMVADYLMMRGTGQPNMYFEEDAQGRLGTTLWQDPQRYIDNSAVYHADRIHTPLLIFHGSEDSSVQPYQGMALFLAMRRLQRPAWLLYYKNEGHQMGGEENCRDFTQKLADFFGYYLKNERKPEWMK